MTTPRTSTTSTIKQAVPEMDCWREQVSAIDGPDAMFDFLAELCRHVAEEPEAYNHEDLAGVLGALSCAFWGDLNAPQLRASAVMLLVALSWDGEAIDIG